MGQVAAEQGAQPLDVGRERVQERTTQLGGHRRERAQVDLEQFVGPAGVLGSGLLDVHSVDGVHRETVAGFGFGDEHLWFNGSIQGLGREGFRILRRARPGAIVQTPVDFLVPLLLAAPELAEAVLETLRAWGVTRASLDWRTPGAHDVLGAVERLGWEVNLYGVPDLESFLEAALLLPASVTADFNFPEWDYHGRGPRAGRPVASSV